MMRWIYTALSLLLVPIALVRLAWRALGPHRLNLVTDAVAVLGMPGSRARVAVECAAGLTDAFIARIPVPPGGKRGHDRPWPMYPDYLLQRRLRGLCRLG